MEIGEIRKQILAGEVERAMSELEEVLAAAPGDFEAKLLLGTCRQLRGDESGFRRIHEEVAPVLDSREQAGEASCVIDAWRRYKRLFRYVAAAGLMVGASTLLCGCYGVPAVNRDYDPGDAVPLDVGAQGAQKGSPAPKAAKPEAQVAKPENQAKVPGGN